MIHIGKAAQFTLDLAELKNSCPACGYFTLMGRANYDICPICFWEDEGYDEKELHKESEANTHTLAEHRTLVNEYITKLLNGTYAEGDIKKDVKKQLKSVDSVMHKFSEKRRRELITEQGKLIALFTYNKIFGLEGLLQEK